MQHPSCDQCVAGEAITVGGVTYQIKDESGTMLADLARLIGQARVLPQRHGMQRVHIMAILRHLHNAEAELQGYELTTIVEGAG